MVKNPPAMQETQVQSPGQEDPLEEVTDRGAWRGYSPWGCKESDRPDPSVHSSCGHDCAHPPTVVNTENTHIHKSIYILLIQKI